jgi:hypothetical protein
MLAFSFSCASENIGIFVIDFVKVLIVQNCWLPLPWVLLPLCQPCLEVVYL